MKMHEAYWNLHKNVLSVRPSGGKVQHFDYVQFETVRFSVQPAGRAKVIREQRKNVHAFVRGYMIDFLKDESQLSEESRSTLLSGFDGVFQEVTYNPYKYDTFVFKQDESPIHKAESAYLLGRRIFAKEAL